jgi:death on curing protein
LVLTLTPNTVKNIHEVVIKTSGGIRGIRSDGILKICLDRPFVSVYGRDSFPTIFNKAGALFYFIAGPFHPFVDGNKRTALVVISNFLLVNGYTFNFPKDFVNFAYSVAKNEIKSNRKISSWIRKACIKNEYYGYDDEIRTAMLMNKHVIVVDKDEKVRLELEKR